MLMAVLEASASSEASAEVEVVLGGDPEKVEVDPQLGCRAVAALLGSGDIVAVKLGFASVAEGQVRPGVEGEVVVVQQPVD